jgi:hypothetical protein
MKIVFIPAWLSSALKEANEPANVAINLEALIGILSKEDVAFYLYINTCLLPDILPQPFVKTFPPDAFLYGKQLGNLMRKNLDDDTYQNALVKIESLVLDMVTNARGTAPFSCSWENLTCDLLDEDTLAFRPINGDNDGIGVSSNAAKLALYDRVIRQLYAFMAFQDLVKTPLMEDYFNTTQANSVRDPAAPQVPAPKNETA